MKVTELMVGDWVIGHATNKPHKVTARDLFLIEECIMCEVIFTPIPLTAEILINSGFESQSNSHFYYDDEYSEIDIHELSDSVWLVECEDLEFSMPSQRMIVNNVHDLQHTLNLCQIDKTIEL